jgi:putative transposase
LIATVRCWSRKSSPPQDAIQKTQRRFPFEIDAPVVLPEHLHAIWTLPSGDTDFSVRWRLIKSQFSKDLPKTEHRTATRVRRGERGIWERRFWEHLIRNERDFHNHLNYCWFNPLTHGLVKTVEDWPHSTFHRDWADWPKACDFEAAMIEYGERNG